MRWSLKRGDGLRLTVGVAGAFLLSSLFFSRPTVFGNVQDKVVLSRPQGPVFAPRFTGDYGIDALTNVTNWASSIFQRTMEMYTKYAQTVCDKPEGCPKETAERHYPEPQGFSKYDLFNPILECPDSESLSRVGRPGDGGKWLCVSLLQDPCVVFSLGSNGDYSFEESILETTNCTVHTFDCTVNGRNISERHHYHKLCLGSAAKAAVDPNFITLEEAVSFVDKVSLLKIDIEGFEFDALASWKQMDTLLPEQIAIEVHHSEVIYMGTPSQHNAKDFSNLLWPMHNLALSDLSLFFSHLATLGYGTVYREDNLAGHCCSEFLLLKVGDWKAK